jgi:hypothetical protein
MQVRALLCKSCMRVALSSGLAQINEVEQLSKRSTESVPFLVLVDALLSDPTLRTRGVRLFLPAGLPRFDLLAQINEVEARQEEYTESLAFLGLVNALLEGVGQGGLPAGGTAVGHYTALVLQYVAGSLWQRGYRCVWHLLFVC